jgi:predicted TPR repeat methyltransferase
MDAVMAVNVLYFIDDLNSFFETIAGWLKPGARAVFGVRSPETIARMPFTQYGFNARCSDEIEALMRASGFNHVDIACYDEGLVSLGDIEIAMDSMIIRGQI